MHAIRSVNPLDKGTSSREAFAALDAAKAAGPAPVVVGTAAEALYDHDPVKYPLPKVEPAGHPSPEFAFVLRETNGTGTELHIDVADPGRVSLWSSDPVLWLNPSEVTELIVALTAARSAAGGDPDLI